MHLSSACTGLLEWQFSYSLPRAWEDGWVKTEEEALHISCLLVCAHRGRYFWYYINSVWPYVQPLAELMVMSWLFAGPHLPPTACGCPSKTLLVKRFWNSFSANHGSSIMPMYVLSVWTADLHYCALESFIYDFLHLKMHFQRWALEVYC